MALLSGSDQAGEGGIQLRAVLGYEAIADADPNSLLLPLQPFPQGKQEPQIPNPCVWVLIVQTLALGDQIGHVGGILGIVLVPTSIEELPVPLHRDPRDEHHLMLAPDQVFSQRLVIIGRGLQAEDYLGKAVLHLQGLGLEEELLESFLAIVKEPSLPKRLAGGGSKEGVVLILGDIQPYDEIALGTSDFLFELTKLLEPGKFMIVHGNLPLKDWSELASPLLS